MRIRWLTVVPVMAILLAVSQAGGVAAQGAGYLDRAVAPEACRPSGDVSPAAALARAEQVMGVPADGRALHYRAMGSRAMDFQSDRSYPPFFDAPDETDSWYDPASGIELRRTRGTYPGSGPGAFSPPAVVGETAAWVVRDSLIPAPFSIEDQARTRRLNPWAVIHDWREERGRITVVGECMARDYPRLVLERRDADGVAERLYLDGHTGMPIQLVRTEPHLLWGQLRSEYIWSTWIALDGPSLFPSASFRVTEGNVERRRTVGSIGLEPPDTAGFPALPVELPHMRPDPRMTAFTAQPPDTIRIADNVFVLKQRAYNEVVVLERDTVFLLDATMSDDRARQDSTWIARLFPGPHPVVVVVTDLAWPHIGGVRFWTARGATIVSHAINRDFLRKVIERRWTVAPDVLESVRANARIRFRAVSDSLSLAGGRIRLHAIDGAGSEGALLAWLPASSFLWPGDFIQDVRGPSLYATDVIRAVRRLGLEPVKSAAEHVPPFDWKTVLEANAAMLARRSDPGR